MIKETPHALTFDEIHQIIDNFALAASERSHIVHLYEASRQLGGQLYLAAAPPGRAGFAVLARDLTVQIGLSPVNIHLNTVVDEALLQSDPPDHVIVATAFEAIHSGFKASMAL